MAEPPLDDSDRADLAALADGTLPPSRRAAVEERVAASPALRTELEAQRAALAAVHAAAQEDGASEGLRRWLAAQPAAPPSRVPRRRLGVGAAALAAAAAVVLALVLVGGGGESALSLEDVASAAAQAPVTGPPARGTGNTLAVSSDGIAFPDWEKRLGWRAIGVREDRVDGRAATTVTYERGEDRFHYAIVPRPAADGVPETGYARTTFEGKPAVAWQREGRTCLLISMRVPADELLALARSTRFY